MVLVEVVPCQVRCQSYHVRSGVSRTMSDQVSATCVQCLLRGADFKWKTTRQALQAKRPYPMHDHEHDYSLPPYHAVGRIPTATTGPTQVSPT